jgi:hypothetical protein
VHYEELVRDPIPALKEICAFVGVPLETRMMSLEGADRLSLYEGRHHSLVKGDRIVSSQQRPENLPPDFKSKIDRYIQLWREQSKGEFPLYAPEAPAAARKPGHWERCTDQLSLWFLRRLDSAVALAFCWAPMPLLKAWRARKRPAGILVPAGDDR